MRIYLTGYRCTGKTTTGKLLAKRLGFSFVDTDQAVEERLGSSITETVSKHGWKFFRAAEKEALKETGNRDDLVVATGGGMVLDLENRKSMQSMGRVVWLTASLETIQDRMTMDPSTGEMRPSLTGRDILEETERILKLRNPLYGEIAEITLDTSHLPPQEAADEILRRIDHGR